MQQFHSALFCRVRHLVTLPGIKLVPISADMIIVVEKISDTVANVSTKLNI